MACSSVRTVVVPNGDYSAAGVEREIDGRGGAGGDGVRLGVEFVILDAIYADGLESPEAYVQRDLGGLDAALDGFGRESPG